MSGNFRPETWASDLLIIQRAQTITFDRIVPAPKRTWWQRRTWPARRTWRRLRWALDAAVTEWRESA